MLRIFGPRLAGLRLSGLRLSALPLAALIVLLMAVPAAAQSVTVANELDLPGLQVEARDGALHIDWGGEVAQAAMSSPNLPLVPYGDVMLPMTTMLVEIPDSDTVVAASIAQLADVPYTGELDPAPVEVPPALGWDPDAMPIPRAQVSLPTAPVTILGEGIQRGRHLAVVAFSPIFQDPTTGELRYAETVSASVAGAQPVPESDALASPDDTSLFAPIATLADALGPTNEWADNNAVKLIVDQAGLQVIDGGAIAAAGMDTPKTATLKLFLDGVEVPLQIIGRQQQRSIEPRRHHPLLCTDRGRHRQRHDRLLARLDQFQRRSHGHAQRRARRGDGTHDCARTWRLLCAHQV